MQAIFQSEISKITVDEALNNLFELEKISDEVKKFSKELANGVEENKEKLDKDIEKKAKNWDIERLNVVVKSILRLAFYESTFKKDVPKAVVINEAVELAKRYADEESARFINGILG